MTTLPTTADVVVIGGGPAGAGALWALGRAMPAARLVLLEQAAQSPAGASNASLENFRTAWTTPALAAMMARSVAVFLDADHAIGAGAAAQIGVKQHGYLYVGFTDADAESLRADVATMHANGLTHTEFLDHAAVQARFGWLGERVVAGKFDPRAGWLDSHALVNALMRAAPTASLHFGVHGVRIDAAGGRVVGVTTAQGTISTPRVVLAAGAHSRRIAQTAGVDLPIVAIPRQSFTTGWRHAAYPASGPCVISASPFPHVRPEAGDGAIFGWEYAWNAKGVRDAADETGKALAYPVEPVAQFRDPRFPSLVLALLARQFGHAPGTGFADPRYLRGIDHRANYYVYRGAALAHPPDGVPYRSQRALIDRHPELDGLIVSVAHGGHGIMSAPATGEIAAAHTFAAPLPDPLYTDFGWNALWVAGDTGGLGVSRL